MDTRYKAPPEDVATVAAVREVLSGRRRGLPALAAVAGPAIVVSVAYLDPGNFATNLQAGARYGYALLWVVLAANIVAMLFQGMAAKLGIVTQKNLAELCREHFPRAAVLPMWLLSELAAMATDVAEFVGGAIGLSLLFKLPLMAGMAVIAIVTWALLLVEGRGFRRIELTIGALVGVVGLSYLTELFIAPVDFGRAGLHLLIPGLPDAHASILAAGIVGATVMPHALFLHSGLSQQRFRPENEAQRRKLIRYSHIEVTLALAAAGAINLAMVLMAAAAFHAGHRDVGEIQTAYHSLTPLLGRAAASIFLIALIASGVASSVVGTMAGQLVMQGFLERRLPLWLRRAITMAPAFVVVWMGFDLTQSLVASQVILSVVLPFPMLALLWLASRQRVMGAYRARAPMLVAAGVAATLVLALNGLLLLQICQGRY